MLKRLLVPVLAAALIPSAAAWAADPAPIAAQTVYLAVLTTTCALFVVGDRAGQGDADSGVEASTAASSEPTRRPAPPEASGSRGATGVTRTSPRSSRDSG